MKARLWIILLIALIIAIAGIGYFGLPVMIEKETTGLRSEVQYVKQRLQKIEEELKVAPLQLDADAQKIIKTINAISLRLNSFEDSFKKDISAMNEAIKRQGKVMEEALKKQAETIEKQKTVTEEALKKQAEAIDKLDKQTETKIQKIKFDTAMATIRGHILKARIDLAAKNMGTAKIELDLVDELFSKIAATTSDENKNAIKELQASLKKARAEIDVNLPAAISRIDLLWHEISKLMREEGFIEEVR